MTYVTVTWMAMNEMMVMVNYEWGNDDDGERGDFECGSAERGDGDRGDFERNGGERGEIDRVGGEQGDGKWGDCDLNEHEWMK